MPVSRFGYDLYSLLLDLSTQSDELFIQLQYVDALNRFDDSIQFEYSGISLNKTGITIPIESPNYKFGFLVASPTLAQQTKEFQNLVISSVMMLAAILEKVRNQNQHTGNPEPVENMSIDLLVKTSPTGEERFRQLIELSSDGVILTDEQGIIIEWNKSQEMITGWSAEECVGKYLWDVRWRYMPQNLRTPETLTRLKEATQRALATGQSTVFREPYEAEIECKDGTRRFEEVLSYPVATENGYMVGILTRDVTQRKITEIELKRREAVLNAVRYSGEILISATSWKEHAQDILKHLGEALDVGRTYIFENHSDGNKLFFSQRYEWCAPGVTPQIDNQLLQNCDLNDGALTNFRRTLEAGDILAGKPSDFSAEEQQFLDGQDILYMASAPIYAGDYWWGFIGFDDLESTRDLDAIERESLRAVATNLGNTIQRENARNALRESELRERTRANELQTLLDSVPAAVWIAHDAACVQMTGNKASYDFLRMPLGTNPSRTGPDNSKTSHFKMLLNDTEITQDQLPMQICASTGQPFFNLEEKIEFDDGTHINLTGNVVPLWDSEGKPNGAIAAFVDITHQKTVEADLKKQMENLAMMNIIDSIITTSFNSDFTLTNILTQLSEKESVEAACIFMMDEEKPVLKYICGQGFRNSIPGHLQINLDQGIIGKVIEKGEMIVTTIDDENNPVFISTLVLGEGFTRCYNIPLVVKKQVKGVLQIYQRSESPYDTDRIEFFDSVAKRVAIAIENSQLIVNLEQTNKDLRLAYDATIEGWSRAMDLRDEETEGHTERVTLMTVELARLAQFPEPELIHMRRGALLHDIGKLGVPDSILMKPGPLTEAEWVIMKRHPEYAFQMLSPIQYLRLATDIPYCHHERWDGSGYPRGLRGESIPLAARLFAVVDVWDALTSDRPYRPAWSGDRAIEYIRMNAGIHFDPNAVSLFLQLDKNAPQN